MKNEQTSDIKIGEIDGNLQIIIKRFKDIEYGEVMVCLPFCKSTYTIYYIKI